jgi:hypothetical protein
MARLIYSAIASADGYVEDAAGSFGGGKRALPNDVRADLELLDTQRFASGAVYLRYRPTSA